MRNTKNIRPTLSTGLNIGRLSKHIEISYSRMNIVCVQMSDALTSAFAISIAAVRITAKYPTTANGYVADETGKDICNIQTMQTLDERLGRKPKKAFEDDGEKSPSVLDPQCRFM